MIETRGASRLIAVCVIAEDLERYEMRVLAVDGTRTLEATVAAVAGQFGLRE